MNENNLLYREFSIVCSRQRLIDLSEWLNDNLAFGEGEDFNKLADAPRESTSDTNDGLPPCKTDRKNVAKWLTLIADLIPQLPDGASLKMQNMARMARNLAKKLTKDCQ